MKFFFLFVISIFLFQCSIVIPPITLTGTKTAAEKQIIGEQTELEDDVWMISSAKTTSVVDLKLTDDSKEAAQTENRFTYKAFSIMDAFFAELAQLKKDGVVGESNKGLLANLLLEKGVKIQPDILEKYNPKYKNDKIQGRSYRTLIETVKQINNARNYLVEGYIVNQKRINPGFQVNREELMKSQKDKYFASSLVGEYLQKESAEWYKK
jgi:hypothetical protein